MYSCDKGVESIYSNDKGVESIYSSDKGVESIYSSDNGVASINSSDKGVESIYSNDRSVESIYPSDKGVESIYSSDKHNDCIILTHILLLTTCAGKALFPPIKAGSLPTAMNVALQRTQTPNVCTHHPLLVGLVTLVKILR